MRIDPEKRADEANEEDKDGDGLSNLDLIRMRAALAFSMAALIYFFMYVLFL